MSKQTRRIACAVALACAAPCAWAQGGNAAAMALSTEGHGQVLVYPYYTVNGGNLTLLTIENTRDEAKAVRVRFREALNGRVVAQFNLYLGPQDMWTAAITPAAGVGAPTGPARLQTIDPSCTVPAIPAAGLEFSRLDYIDNSASGGANRQDHPNSLLATHSAPERTRAGSIEVIEMGVLRPGTAPTQLAEEVTAVAPADPLTQPARPADCAAVVRAWEVGQGGWADVGGSRDIDLPRGGLAGTAAIVDVADGTLMGYRPEAIAGFHANTAAPGALHDAPDAAAPDLGDCNHGNGRCNVLFPVPGGPVQRFVFEAGGARAWDALSTVFMAEGIQAEHVTEAGIAGRTEWAVTSPTRQFYVDHPAAEAVRAPFSGLPFVRDGQSCDEVSNLHFNREEVVGTPFLSTPGFPTPRFCFQSSLPTFNENQFVSPILGELRRFTRDFSTTSPAGVISNPAAAPELASGYSDLRFFHAFGLLSIAVDTEQTYRGPQRFGTVRGLPLAGIAFRTAINANARPGLLASYGGAFSVIRRRVLTINPPAPANETGESR